MVVKKISNYIAVYIDYEWRVEYRFGSLVFIRTKDNQRVQSIRLYTSIKDSLFCRIPLLERLFRYAPKNFERISDNTYVFSKKGGLYILDFSKLQINRLFSYAKGTSNPLYFCLYKRNKKTEIVFGDYGGHDNKNNIGIYRYSDNSVKRIGVFSGKEIDHIHRVEYDEIRDCYWILTGDSDEGSGFWILDYYGDRPAPYMVGKQMYRACVFFLMESGFIYATDSQLEDNHIYYVDYNMKKVQEITGLPGSCIYGVSIYSKNGTKQFCFSTAVETSSNVRDWKYFFNNKRGKSIYDNYSHLFVGNLKMGFREIWKSKKDFLPMVFFQFGNILFPSQHIKGKLYFYPQACSIKGTFEVDLFS